MQKNRLLDLFMSASSVKTVRKQTASTSPASEERRPSPRTRSPTLNAFPISGKRSGAPLKEPVNRKRSEQSELKDTYLNCTEKLRKLRNYPNIVAPALSQIDVAVAHASTAPVIQMVAAPLECYSPTIKSAPQVVSLVETQIRHVIEISSDENDSTPESVHQELPSPVETRQTSSSTFLEDPVYRQLEEPTSPTIPDQWTEYRNLHTASFHTSVTNDVPEPKPTQSRHKTRSKGMRALMRRHRLAAMLNPIHQSNQHRL